MANLPIVSRQKKLGSRFAIVTMFATGTEVFGSPTQLLNSPSLCGLLCTIDYKMGIKCACGMLGLINTTCTVCNEAEETCQHLFFSCRYSRQIWKILAEGLLQDRFTTEWSDLIEIITTPGLTPIKNFLLRYVFQATIHSIWRERNSRRHGEQAKEAHCLAKFVDKTVRLWLLSLQGRGKIEGGLATWFGTRVETLSVRKISLFHRLILWFIKQVHLM